MREHDPIGWQRFATDIVIFFAGAIVGSHILQQLGLWK